MSDSISSIGPPAQIVVLRLASSRHVGAGVQRGERPGLPRGRPGLLGLARLSLEKRGVVRDKYDKVVRASGHEF